MKRDIIFFSQIFRPDQDHREKHNKPSVTNMAGYISTKQRIENMMIAGARLKQYREENYDFTGNEKDEDIEKFSDVTRNRGFDMADAFQEKIAAENRIKERARIRAEAIRENPGSTPMVKDEKGSPNGVSEIPGKDVSPDK